MESLFSDVPSLVGKADIQRALWRKWGGYINQQSFFSLGNSGPLAEILTWILYVVGPSSLITASPSLASIPFPCCTFFTAPAITWKCVLLSKAYRRSHEKGILFILFKAACPETRRTPGKFIHSFTVCLKHLLAPGTDPGIDQEAEIPSPRGAYIQVP